jgi:hypothetical protein
LNMQKNNRTCAIFSRASSANCASDRIDRRFGNHPRLRAKVQGRSQHTVINIACGSFTLMRKRTLWACL